MQETWSFRSNVLKEAEHVVSQRNAFWEDGVKIEGEEGA